MDDDYFNNQAGHEGAHFSDDEEDTVGTKVLAPINQPLSGVIITANFEFGKDEESGLKTIGEYKIHGEIGDGSFSTVKKLESLKDGHLCALKIYNKLYLESQRKIDFETGQWTNLLARIERELNLWVNLDHPNICKLLEIYEVPGQKYLYLQMEIGDLGQVSDFDTTERTVILNSKVVERYSSLKGIKTREGVVKDLFRQLLEGLDYLHNHGVYHGDVKLENVVITKDLVVKWIDFNSAKQFKAGDKLTEYEGTLQYSPPECIFGLDEGYNPPAADLWSLGVCLYALHFQVLPYDMKPDDNEFAYEIELNKMIRDQPADFKAGFITPDLKELLEGLLTKDPASRWTAQQVRSSKYLSS